MILVPISPIEKQDLTLHILCSGYQTMFPSDQKQTVRQEFIGSESPIHDGRTHGSPKKIRPDGS